MKQWLKTDNIYLLCAVIWIGLCIVGSLDNNVTLAGVAALLVVMNVFNFLALRKYGSKVGPR